MRARQHGIGPDDGFSVGELMIASAIGLFVLSLAYLIFETTLRSFNRVETFTQQSRGAALAMSRVTKPMREASRLDVAQDYAIQFNADSNDDGTKEIINCSLPSGSTTFVLSVTSESGTTTSTLATNVQNRALGTPLFTYYAAPGESVAGTEGARYMGTHIVHIRITTQTTQTITIAPCRLDTDVMLRNVPATTQ